MVMQAPRRGGVQIPQYLYWRQDAAIGTAKTATKASKQARAEASSLSSFHCFARLAFWLGSEFAGRWPRIIEMKDNSEAGSQ